MADNICWLHERMADVDRLRERIDDVQDVLAALMSNTPGVPIVFPAEQAQTPDVPPRNLGFVSSPVSPAPQLSPLSGAPLTPAHVRLLNEIIDATVLDERKDPVTRMLDDFTVDELNKWSAILGRSEEADEERYNEGKRQRIA